MSLLMARRGLFAGHSSGAYVLGAKFVAEVIKSVHIATITIAIGERYFSTSMWG